LCGARLHLALLHGEPFRSLTAASAVLDAASVSMKERTALMSPYTDSAAWCLAEALADCGSTVTMACFR
jgi:hypothetical protein